MIGWIVGRIATLVVDPQSVTGTAGTIDLSDLSLSATHSLVAKRDPDPSPLAVEAQEIDVLALSTAPVDGTHEIGVGVELRHVVSVGLSVEHGNPVAAKRIRDAITTALVLRLLSSETAIRSTRDPATGQYVSRLEWAVDYRPLFPDTPNEYATLTFTIDATLDR